MIDDERGPNALARDCEARLAQLKAGLELASSEEKRAIRSRIHEIEGVLRFCKTRVGYRPRPESRERTV